MATEFRELGRRYWAILAVMLVLGSLAAQPAMPALLAQSYIQFCDRILSTVPFGQRCPALLTALFTPMLVALLSSVAIALVRQVIGVHHLARHLQTRHCRFGHEHQRVIAKLSKQGDLTVTTDSTVYAFCSGLLRPKIYVSQGLLDTLTADEVEAVLIHELHHARRRDPLRFFLSDLLARLAPLVPVLATLDQWVRIRAELAADGSVLETHPVEILESALLKVMRSSSIIEHRLIVAGISPTEARIAALLGHPLKIDLNTGDLVASLLAAFAIGLIALWLALPAFSPPLTCVACSGS